MRVSKITIKKFRSVKDTKLLPDNFNIFVGQNNHGKTNLFEAIDWFFNGLKKGEDIDKIRFGRTGTDEVSVEIEFSEAKSGIERMKNQANKTKMREVLGETDSIVVKRSSMDLKKRTIFSNGKWLEKQPNAAD